MKYLLPWVSMLTKTKNIRKKKINFQIFKNVRGYGPGKGNNQNLKEIRALGTEIIATRKDDGQRDQPTADKFRFHEFC